MRHQKYDLAITMDEKFEMAFDNSARPARSNQKLLLVVIAFVLMAPIASYLSSRQGYVGSTLLLGGATLIMYGFTICVFLSRAFRLKIRGSLLLLISVALLAIYPFSFRAEHYVIDQLRFRMDQSFYVAAVKRSQTSPKFVTFNWGSNGLAGSTGHYFLVFDESGAIGRERSDPTGLLLGPDSSSVCRSSVVWLSNHFYSVEIAC